MQAYIEAHLREPLTMAAIARAGNYSIRQAQLLFRDWTGLPVMEYVRALRLSHAALILRDGGPAIRVLDIALEFDFASQEGFTRAFSRRFGLPPGAYRKNPKPIGLFTPYRADARYQFLKNPTHKEHPMTTNPQAIFVQVMEFPARRLILKRASAAATDYFTFCADVGCDVWGVLTSIPGAIREPLGLWLPPALRTPGTGEYAQGVEMPADYTGSVPEGYDTLDLPACTMMVFQGEPYANMDFMSAIAQVQQKIAAYDPTLYGFTWAPDNQPRFQMEPQGHRGYIEGRPVRRA